MTLKYINKQLSLKWIPWLKKYINKQISWEKLFEVTKNKKTEWMGADRNVCSAEMFIFSQVWYTTEFGKASISRSQSLCQLTNRLGMQKNLLNKYV